MIPYWPKLASLAQNTCLAVCSSVNVFIALKGNSVKNLLIFHVHCQHYN